MALNKGFEQPGNRLGFGDANLTGTVRIYEFPEVFYAIVRNLDVAQFDLINLSNVIEKISYGAKVTLEPHVNELTDKSRFGALI